MHDLLRERIVTHAIKPGDAIRQDALAAELGVSKIPVREALSRLEVAGLVRYSPNRGFVTLPLTQEELDDIFHLRLLVEPATAAIGAARASEEARDLTRRLLAELAASKPDLANTAPQRKALLLALMSPAGRPATEFLVRRMFYLAERYLPEAHGTQELNISRLHELTDRWLQRETSDVEKLVSERLRDRWGLARQRLAAGPPTTRSPVLK